MRLEEVSQDSEKTVYQGINVYEKNQSYSRAKAKRSALSTYKTSITKWTQQLIDLC